MKTTKTLAAIIILAASITKAAAQQPADSAFLELRYESSMRQSVEEQSHAEPEWVLQIGTKSSHFYDYTSQLMQQKTDSVVKSTVNSIGLPMETNTFQASVSLSSTGWQIFKNYPSEGKMTHIEAVGGKNYRVEENMPQMEWQLLEGDTVVADYPCQKAQTTWRGRTWTVWYTFDLPYSDGPWKLCGLPGTILAAKDNNGDFSFSCIGIKKISPVPINSKVKAEKCNGKELQTMKTKEAKDPIGFVLESLGLGNMGGSVQVISAYDDNGKPAEIPSSTPVFMEEYE